MLRKIGHLHKTIISAVLVISVLTFLFSLDRVFAISLQPAVNYPTASGPYGVTIGDFNNDGKNDIVSANYFGANISFLAGVGDGTFALAVNQAVSAGLYSIASADFNHDNNLDIVVAVSISSKIGVMLGNGDGTFSVPVYYNTSNPHYVTVSDLNNDNNIDIIVANNSGNNVSVLMGDGSGAFSASVNYPTTSKAPSVVVADFNNDNKKDIAASNAEINTVSIFLGNGDGTFGLKTDYATGPGSMSITSGDFNHDGNIDLATASMQSNNAVVILGDGQGSFGASVNYTVGQSPYRIISSDLDKDGNLDLIVANIGGGSISVLAGVNDGTFLNATNFSVGNSPIYLASANINTGDNIPDVVVANGTSSNVSVLLGIASAPGQVTSLSANAISETEINLSWTTPSNGGSPVIGYKIERESPIGGGWSILVADTGDANTTFFDTGLTAGTEYNYRVSAINLVGVGAFSNEANATTDIILPDVEQPTNLIATTVSSSEINLNWDYSSGGELVDISFMIERESPIGGGWSILVADTGDANTTFSDTGLTSGTQYNYRVSAINSVGAGLASNEANATTKTQSSGGGGGSGGYVCLPPKQWINGACVLVILPPVVIDPPDLPDITTDPIVPPEVPPQNPPEIPPQSPPETPPQNPPIVPDIPTTPITPDISNLNISGNISTGNSSGVIADTLQENIVRDLPIASTAEPVRAQLVLGLIAIALTLNYKEIGLSIFRFWSMFLGLLGIRKRSNYWGIVYDSVTKRPLDPVYVTLINEQGKQVGSCITDMDGRYGFLVNEGVYTIDVKKGDYQFPSYNLLGRNDDELYKDIYHGEKITISSHSEVIYKNIPMDPLKFNWNEFIKEHNNLNKFYSSRDLILYRLTFVLFIIGILVSIVATYFDPSIYNICIIFAYIVLFILEQIGIKRKNKGLIIEKSTGKPMPFSIIRVYSSMTGTEIGHKVADEYGNFFCLVPNGNYFIKVDKKLDSGEYVTVYNSGLINVNKGIINSEFEI